MKLPCLSSGNATAKELQHRNSILPEDFWEKSEIDWNTFARGTKPRS